MFSFNLISVLRTKPTKCHSIDCPLILIIVLFNHLITEVSSESKPIRNMETIEFNSEPVFRVIVNRDNNDIIVGARNAVYRLSSDDLQKSEEFRIGPVNDSIECLPPPFDCEADKKLVNNDNQILLIHYQDKGFPLLLACGDAYQGMCWVLKATNLSWVKPYGMPNDSINFLGSKSSSFAFMAPSSTSKNVLYVANAYDGRPLQWSPPAVSSRRLNGLSGFQLSHNSDTAFTKVDIHSNYKQTYNVRYIYGFNHSHYSYFLSNQPMSVRDGAGYESRLIRICQKDNEFFSYMEIPLICRVDKNDSNGNPKTTDHSISSTAYFGKIGPQKYKDLDIFYEYEADTLFVAMGVPAINEKEKFNLTFGSAICAFSIKQINRAFTDATKECFRAENDVHILETIRGRRENCQPLNLDVPDNFCGSGQNPYITTNKPLNGLFLTSINGKVTSLAVAIQSRYTVAAIGTEEGYISKVVIDRLSAEKPLFEMNISDQPKDRSIRANPAFDRKEKYLYLLSGNQLVKFPFGSCSLHTDCASCLNTDSIDPLRCGWCDSYCATDEECQFPTLMSRSRCPPELFDFTPKSGPLSGGTLVTISGENFGSPHSSVENSNIHITIAGTECKIRDWQPRRVQCQTTEVKKEVSGKVLVRVQDLTGDINGGRYDINGTAESSEEFKFLEPQLLGVYPSFGPIEGGTNVTIIGKNLHIGSNRTIQLGGIECRESNNNSTFLSCMSGLQINNISDDTSVKLFIDFSELIMNQNKTITLSEIPDSMGTTIKEEFQSLQWSESFEYKPNPRIISYEPKNTIKSGNTNITVTGINLNSVSNPRILVTAFSPITKQQIRTESQCRVSPSGNQMTCPTPAIRDPIPPPKIKVPIDTQLSFILDGVKNYGLNPQKSRLIYFPDPTYYSFDDGIRDVYLEEPVLKIDGKDLTSDYPIDIRINEKHGIPCNLSESKTFDAIYCQIQYNDIIFKNDGQKHGVRIKVGKITFSPGSVKFIPKPSKGIGVGAIMASIFIPLFLVTGIVAIILYYLKNQGIIWKEKKPLDYSVHFRPGDPENFNRPPYSAQSSTNAYEEHGVTRPLLPVRRFQVSEETMNLLRAESILIARENITLEQVLGQGHFGCVYKGLLRAPGKESEREVALKTLQSAAIREEMDVESFLQEGLIMKDFRHHHVLTLIGVSFEEDGSPIVVLPFMENGDLLSYIRDEKNNPTVKNLLLFAIDIAKGMDYLSSQKFVHRDLAARNCMLDSDLTAKVADFGLSRDIYEREYYSSDNKKCKLPVKWMAPESLEKGTYNTKTDVWSYGVVVWELLTRGVTPYPDVDNWEILNYLKQGRRMPRPSFCPEMLYFILLRCWSDDPKLRPTFDALVNEVQTLIAKLEKSAEKQRVELDKCNTYVNYPVPNTYYNEQQSKQAVNTEDNTQPKASSAYETTC